MTWHDMLWLIGDELCHLLKLDPRGRHIRRLGVGVGVRVRVRVSNRRGHGLGVRLVFGLGVGFGHGLRVKH